MWFVNGNIAKMKAQESARTVVELLVFLVNLAVAILVAAWGWHRFGWSGLILGLVCGFAFLPAVFYLVIHFIRTDRKK